MQAVKSFQVTLAAVHKSSRACEFIVAAIARTPCCVAPQMPDSTRLPSLQEALSFIEAHHQEVCSLCGILSNDESTALLLSYSQIAPWEDCDWRNQYLILCTQVVGDLVQRYRRMSELLRKVEEAVLGSITGRAPGLAQYYAHWERAIFHALDILIVGGMTSLQKLLDAPASGVEPRAPLFEVTWSLLPCSIVRLSCFNP